MEEPVDVARIMKEIRESIQRKRAAGVVTEEEVESLADVRVRSWADSAELDPRLLERLLGPSHDWNVRVDYLIRTTRTGSAARLLVWAKKLVRPFVRLYSDHLWNRQAQINQFLYHLLLGSIRENARLQVEVTALKQRCAELEKRPSR